LLAGNPPPRRGAPGEDPAACTSCGKRGLEQQLESLISRNAVTVTAIHPTIPSARRAPARRPELVREARPLADRPAPVAALRLPGHVFRAVAPLLEATGFDVLDITAHERGPRPQLVVLELPEDEQTGRALLAPPQNGPGRLFLSPGELGPWATIQWAGDEIVRSPFHRLQVVAAALRVGRAPAETVAEWSDLAFDDLAPLWRLDGQAAPSRSACA
jgi:hypothetical protein